MESEQFDDHWEFYFCQIEGKVHSTMVNISLHERAPLSGLHCFQCIEIDLLNPNPENGMTTNEESERLSEMEDLIFQCESRQLRYVARQTGNRKRKFYFYSSNEANLHKTVEKIESGFSDYQISTFNFEDVEWSTYFDDLYPNEIALNEISNRRVCDQLEANGDDPSLPRIIDHNVVFQNKKKAGLFAGKVEELGFSVDLKTAGFWRKTHDLLVQRLDCPSDLDPVTFELKQLAEYFGDFYDGWGCNVVGRGSE